MEKNKNRLTLYIIIGCIVGIIVGYAYHSLSLTHRESVAYRVLHRIIQYSPVLTDMFLRLIKMIIGILVFTTLTAGVAKLGDMKSIGRIGLKTLFWFVGASLLSLSIGLVFVHIFNPSLGDTIALPHGANGLPVSTESMGIKNMMHHIIPENFIEALRENNILQIIVFSLLFSMACISLGDYSKPVVDFLERTSHIILKMTFFIMYVAPIAVFGSLASVIGSKGLGVLSDYGLFIVEFYSSLAVLWIVLMGIFFVLVRKEIFAVWHHIKEAILLAFSTASSEAAFPQLLQGLEKAGCSPKISGFVLPLGYSFNLDGSMMYMTFASIFIANAYGIELSIGTEIAMLLTLMITSKGIAGVPRASLLVIAATLSMFNIPPEGILLLLPIDHFLDMGRSATNIWGNAIATKVIDKWER